jgi:choline dehydrogenase-like flavoprotein
MGHLSGRIARVRFTTPAHATTFGFERDAEGVYLRPRFTFSRAFLLRERLPNVEASLVNPDIWDASHGSGVLSFAYLALTSFLGPRFASDAIRKAATGDRPRAVAPHVANMLRDLPRTAAFVATFGVRRFLLWRRVPGFFTWSAANVYPLHYHAEQVPNPESRVTLSGVRDALGMRRLHVDLRFSAQDVDGVVRAHRHWDGWLRRHGAGSLEYGAADLEAAVWDQARDGFHQVGTTRMAARAEDGVVDPDLRVHGTEDLFVSSSSVFPTSGQANPTFTLVAFALRLADHLRERVLR